MADRISKYSDFFDFYLGEHSLAATRWVHYIGSICGLAALGLGLWTRHASWLLVGAIAGYGFAWFGHLVFEKNRPATFTYPLWSFVADYHMFFLMVLGRLNQRRALAREQSHR